MRLLEELKAEADRTGRPIADVLAECLAASLMSDDDDPTHIHWLKFQELLEVHIRAYNR